MYDSGKRPEPQRNPQNRGQDPREVERQRYEQKACADREAAQQKEAQRSAELRENDPEAYAKLEAQKRARIEELIARSREVQALQKADPAYIAEQKALAEKENAKAAEKAKVDARREALEAKARQRAVDKANGIIHPSDPEAVIHYISGEDAVLTAQERAQAVQKGVMPPLFAELREWADNMRAHPEVPMEELYPKSTPPATIVAASTLTSEMMSAFSKPEVSSPALPTQVQSPRPSTVPLSSQSAGLASANLKPQETNLKPLTLEQQFEHNTAQKAQSLLQANKARLTSEQAQYLQDKNPNSERWTHLWQAASQKREFQQQQANLQQQYALTVREIDELSAQADLTGLMSTPEESQNSPKHKQLSTLSVQRQRLAERIAIARQMQVSLEYAYPALTAVQGETGEHPQDIQTVQGQLPKEFDGIRGHIDKLSAEVSKDPSTALLFDSVVTDALLKGGHNSQQRKELSTWLEQERGNQERLSQLGQGLGGGLFLASFIPQLRGLAPLIRLLGAGTLGATFAYDLPDLMLLDAAAQSGRGGAGELTGQSPEQARFNLVMGYTNVALAGLDVGAEVGVVRNLERVVGQVSAAGAQVSRQMWGQVMNLAQRGEAGIEKARELLESIGGMTGEMVDRAMDAITPLETPGVGKVSRAEMRAQGTAETTTEAAVQKAKANGQKKLKDMTPAERLAYSQDKYGQVRNWDQVEPLIGQTINQQTKLPSGYRLLQKPGSQQLFILRENVDDASFVPLMIEKGKIQAGRTRLSSDAMRANLKAVGINVPDGWQVNHLVPDAVAQSDPMMIEMLKRNIYDVDHVGNLLPMPGKAEMRKANADLIGHQGSHENFNNLVREQLRQRRTILIREHGSLSKVPDNELKESVKGIEDAMREEIINRSSDIPTRYDPETGTRVLSEGLSDPDFVA